MTREEILQQALDEIQRLESRIIAAILENECRNERQTYVPHPKWAALKRSILDTKVVLSKITTGKYTEE